MGRPAHDLGGQRFGKWTVIERSAIRTSVGAVKWSCRCDCGSSADVAAGNLRSGQSKSCGCDCFGNHTGGYYGNKFKDLTGTVINRWTVIKRCDGIDRSKWLCRCSCGTVKQVEGGNLRKGLTNSCGCLQREAAASLDWVHGMKNHPIHNTWTSMKSRCLNKNNDDYRYYGAKGVTICDRWMDFKNFRDDMMPTWQEGLTLDREDPTGNYEQNNCRWATWEVQYANKRSNYVKGTTP